MTNRRSFARLFSHGVLLVLSFSPPTWAQSSKTPVFVNVTNSTGINFQHSFGDDEMSNIVEATGSGCAFLDYNNDGYLDIYVVNGCYLEEINDPEHAGVRHINHLFHNNGDGSFKDVTDIVGVGDPGYGIGCVVGDYDNDGDSDLFVTNYGPDALYKNNGNGTFTDVTKDAGVGCALWGVGAVFFDYDNDGYLDLFVGNYLEFDPEYRLYYEADEFPGPLAYPGQQDVLYHNNGDGTFADATESAGVLKEGRAMGVLSSDYDDDGWVDLFVANDAMENYMYHNNGDGTFTEVGLEAGVAFSEHGDASSSMGGDFADYDLDGDLDLLVPDMVFNSFYRNMGNGFFEDVSAQIGVGEISGQYWSWGGDLFDYDNDGDLDIFIVNLDQPSVLLRNDGGNNNHWILIDLTGTESNRDGIGARVTVRTGNLKQTEELKTSTGYLSQNDPRLHFGLGDKNRVDEIVIRWPGGTTQRLTDIEADQIISVTEPTD